MPAINFANVNTALKTVQKYQKINFSIFKKIEKKIMEENQL
jgi:hypothetical protein